MNENQLKELLHAVCALTQSNCASVILACQKISGLLSHAIELLHEQFLSMNSNINQKIKKTSIHQEMGALEDANLLTILQRALALADELNQQLGAITRSLQVEDIVSQILDKLLKHMQATQILVDQIENPPNSSEAFVNIDNLINEIKNLTSKELFLSIEQNSLDEGGIELF